MSYNFVAYMLTLTQWLSWCVLQMQQQEDIISTQCYQRHVLCVQGKVPGNQFVLTTQLILLPTLLGWTILYLVFKYGSKFINRPLLRPDLSQTWK